MKRWKTNGVRALAVASALSLSGCGPVATPAVPSDDDLDSASSELRELKRKEALADFSQITGAFEALYGPKERKESRYGFRFDSLRRQTESEIRRGRTDRDFLSAFQRFGAKFLDGHIDLAFNLTSDSTAFYFVPFLVTPFEGRQLLTAAAPEFIQTAKVSLGDELVAIDGVPVKRLLERINPYVGIPNPLALQQFASQLLTTRLEYFDNSLVPKDGALGRFEFVKADGTKQTVEAPWTKGFRLPRKDSARAPTGVLGRKGIANELAQMTLQRQAELNGLGRAFPFFFSPKVSELLKPQLVRPSDESLKAFNTPVCDSGGYDCYRLFAATYTYAGKKVLFARIPDYDVSTSGTSGNGPEYFQALFAQFQPAVDVLIVDQTHNPGGFDFFAATIYQSLLREPGPTRGTRFNTDRRTLQDYREFQQELEGNPDPATQQLLALIKGTGDAIETGIDQDKPLTDVLREYTLDATLPPVENGWRKPFVVLADELSLSNGDFFPMLVKASKQGVVFGARTGGLGGNVEEVVTTSNNNISLRLTRNLAVAFKPDGKYVDADFPEDNGVVPDVAYDLKAKDYQEGYTSYVKAFSDLAAGLVK
jgi:hypothetical protein